MSHAFRSSVTPARPRFIRLGPSKLNGSVTIPTVNMPISRAICAAIGAAQAKKLNNDDNIIYVLLGDGEMQEGQIWEALMYAAHNKLDNIIATIDYNGQQIDGKVDEVNSLTNIKNKLESFGWKVFESDGHDYSNILKTLENSKKSLKKGSPVINIMKTIMGKGVDFMENSHKWHGIPPNDEQLKIALNQNKETLGDY